MTRSAETAARTPDAEVARVLVVDDSPSYAPASATIELLASHGYRTGQAATIAEVLSSLDRERPDLVVMIDRNGPSGASSQPGLSACAIASATEAGLPILAVVEDPGDPSLAHRLREFDDWVVAAAARSELPVRIDRLLERARSGVGASLGPRFLSLIVHDLRTPLNVIGLSLRIVAHAVPEPDAELQEDLRSLDENFQIMVRMLNQITDFHRLRVATAPLDPTAFDPRRLVSELLAATNEKAGPSAPAAVLEIDESCPPEVTLDPLRARQAIEYALSNATLAARGKGPVRVRLAGGPNRWSIEVAVDQPPHQTVTPTALSPVHFERICGSEAERRGMDLSIAARISALFGGEARLEVRPGAGTSIVLDWPATRPPDG